jgi:hypothetical protein
MLRLLMGGSLLALLAITGCGGSSKGSASSTAASTATSTAASNCRPALGIASGEALVGSYSTAKYQIPFALAQAFRIWVSGQAAGNEPGAPSKPLCPEAREAAAAVVLQYATKHAHELSANATPNAGGKNLLGYLESHGVVCGSHCGVQPGANGATAAAAAANATRALNQRTASNNKACGAADNAGLKLAHDAIAGLKNPTSTTTATINGDLRALASALEGITSQANAGQQSQLHADIEALRNMVATGSGGIQAQAVSIGLGTAPLKQLATLVGGICQ